MSNKFTTTKVRFAFVRVFEPDSFNGGDEKYSVRLLIPKDDKEFLRRYNAALEEAKEIGKDRKWKGKIPAKLDLPLRDGDELDEEKYTGHAGHWYINAKSTDRPTVVKPAGKNKDGKNILVDIEDKTEFYSGCYGLARITLWPFEQAGNRGISAILEGVVKTQDGEAFGGGNDSKSAFEDEDLGLEDINDDEDDFLQ